MNSQAPQAQPLQALMSRMAAGLRQAAEVYNQTVAEPVRVSLLRSEADGLVFTITIDSTGFRFRYAGGSWIEVYRLNGEAPEPYARIHPHEDDHGTAPGWREEQLFAGGQTQRCSENRLVERFLLAAVRQRLFA